MKGKLLAIEGSDASGKKTQALLLLQRLRSEGYRAELISFPRYKAFFGRLVKRYLKGEMGPIQRLPPELPALLYALDRFDAAEALGKKLKQGRIIVVDRFSASNLAYQAAKLRGKERKEFIKWLERIESRLPQPTLTVYLDVPVSVSQQLMLRESRKKDLHEKNTAYLKGVRRVYLLLAKQGKWKKIDCVRRGKMLPKAAIHQALWREAKKYL